MVLNLISQSLTSSLHWADVADLKLAESNGRIEVEPLDSLCNHLLRTFHSCVDVHIRDATLMQS